MTKRPATSVRPRTPALWLAAAAALLVAEPAFAQGLLRGTTDDDVITRIGRTAGDAQRNVSLTGRRSATNTQTGARVGIQEQRRAATRGAAQRSRSLTPRRLERQPNTAVSVPTVDQIPAPGLLLPQQVRPVRRAQDDPYAPLGLRLGSGLVFPTLDVQSGYDSNPARAANGRPRQGSAVVRVESGFTARTDWSRHELGGELRGSYSRFTSLPSADRPEGNARVFGRYDISSATALDAELRGRLDSQTPGTANLTGAAQGRPLTFQYGGSVGATQRFNRLALSLRGSIDRSEFEDARDANGNTISQRDRQFTQYGLRLRAGYEVTPGITPFAEVLVDTRNFDLRTDNAGFQRNSVGAQGRVGTSFELTRTLTGEALVGYGGRRFEDQRLRSLNGPVVEAALTWVASPLTTLRLRGTTEFEETTIAGSSGSIARRISLDLSHAFLRNLIFNAGASISRANFSGITRQDEILRANVGLDYSVSRNLVLRASYLREQTRSNVAGNNISSNVLLFGARLQF